MTILHANSDPKFTARLRDVLAEANGAPNSIDIAVGYFYLSGFAKVADLLASRPGRVRILIGRTDTPTRQEILAGYGASEFVPDPFTNQNRRDEVQARDSTIDNVGRNASQQPQTDVSEDGIKSLAKLIADGKVEVRAYVKDRMHAKVYIGYTGLTTTPGTAIIGSTNFSASGFTGNTELNYPVTHGGDIREVSQWFERLWSQSEQVNERVVEQLNNSWPLAAPEPYLIYLKVLYELYGDTLGEDQSAVSTEPPVELTEYQQDAVAAGLAMLQKHGGCYIADVVGMGKTYIGAEILRRLSLTERDAGDPLVICPASLQQMWEQACDLFGLVNADVLSRGRLTTDRISNDRSLQKLLRNSGPVLIDEAHGFRNNSQRRHALLDFLKGAKQHKVILLSATPQNLAPRDILQQLELFLNPNSHGLPGVAGNLGPYFPRDGAKADPEKVAQVLQHVLIRRRRQDILRNYPNTTLNGHPVRFPEPKLSNREYSLDHVYRKAGGLPHITSMIQQYKAARYKPAQYLNDEAKTLPEYANIVQSERGNLAGIMTTNLWKRLESSIPAFRSTLQVLIDSNRRFRNQILSGNVSQDEGVQDSEEELTINIPQGEELDSDSLDVEEEYVIVKDKSYPAGHFNCSQWLSDLEKDGQTLGRISEALEGIGPEDDAKLHEIKSFIKAPGVSGEKLLVFTGSKVTAKYLSEELQADNPEAHIDLVMGGDGRTADKIAKFSPKSNGKPDLPESEQTRIMIATDVLAEGQNLQDCNRVFSYDLHWNPVTLIQRHGRVDRLTTEHSEVYLHNMMPDPAVEKEIGVRGTVAARVQAFHDLIGLDNAILETGERVNPDSIYGIYNGEMPVEEDTITDSLAIAQEANALLNRVRREQPELWERLWLMPDGLRTAMADDDHPSIDATIVLVANGSEKQGYAVSSNLEAVELTHAELVRQMECSPDTLAVPLPFGTNRRVTAAATVFTNKLTRAAPAQPRRRDNQASRYISTQLSQLRMEPSNDANYLRSLESLRVAFASALPQSINENVRRLMREKVEGRQFAAELISLMPGLSNPTDAGEGSTSQGGATKVVCSMGIAGTP